MELTDTSITPPIETLLSQLRRATDSPRLGGVLKSASKWLQKRDRWILKHSTRLNMWIKRYWVRLRVPAIPKPICMRLATKLRSSIGRSLLEIILRSVNFNGIPILLQGCTRVNTDLLLLFMTIINKTMRSDWDSALRSRRTTISWCVLGNFKTRFHRWGGLRTITHSRVEISRRYCSKTGR